MKYFTDLESDKDIEIGITNLLSNITQKPDSHKGGWTKLLRCQLINAGFNNVHIITNTERIERYSVVIFDLGAEFGGTLNLFGGLDEKAYKRTKELLDFKGRLYSWRNEVPDLDKVIESRVDNNSTYEGFKSLPKLNLSIPVFRHVEHKKHLLFGDSHTPSVWDPSMMIERQDGRTLYGTLKKDEITEAYQLYKPDRLTIYLSNIDIRHHLNRTDDAHRAGVTLVLDLKNSLPLGVEIELIQPLPIENESRKIPKTGFFKGTAYHGTWFERNSTRTTMSISMENICEEEKWDFYRWPDNFYNEAHELTFDVMEKPKSIHISPRHYKWNLEDNKERYASR